VRNGLFNSLILGDIAKKHDTGGIFWIEEPKKEQKRYENKEISFTAPMYGYKMREAKHEAAIFENSVLDSVTITKNDFRKYKIKGTRRLGRILPEITIDEVYEGLELSFMLPKGSYATTVLREFMKNDHIFD
jgi:tRNA pseudouridine13 synthase